MSVVRMWLVSGVDSHDHAFDVGQLFEPLREQFDAVCGHTLPGDELGELGDRASCGECPGCKAVTTHGGGQ